MVVRSNFAASQICKRIRLALGDSRHNLGHKSYPGSFMGIVAKISGNLLVVSGNGMLNAIGINNLVIGHALLVKNIQQSFVAVIQVCRIRTGKILNGGSIVSDDFFEPLNTANPGLGAGNRVQEHLPEGIDVIGNGRFQQIVQVKLHYRTVTLHGNHLHSGIGIQISGGPFQDGQTGIVYLCLYRFTGTSEIVIGINTNLKSITVTLWFRAIQALNQSSRTGAAPQNRIGLGINLNRKNVTLNYRIHRIRIRSRIRIVITGRTGTAAATAGCKGNSGKHRYRKFIKF